MTNPQDFETPLPTQLPAELRRWSWGAFLLNWIWGLCNGTFIALLMFVPVANLVMPFVLGAKGNEWAWRNGRWRSVAHFRDIQRRWAVWGFAAFGVTLLAMIGFVALVFTLMGTSEPYRLGVARLQADPRVVAALGTPIKAGYPQGSIDTHGTTGEADYSFSASGPKSSGQVELKATEEFGQWTISSLKVKPAGHDEIIAVVTPVRDAPAVTLGNYRLTIPGSDDAKSTFATSDKEVVLTIDYRRATEGTHVMAHWRKADAGGDREVVKSDIVLDAAALAKNQLTFSITADRGLSAGDYHVDVTVDGTAVKSVLFKVVAP